MKASRPPAQIARDIVARLYELGRQRVHSTEAHEFLESFSVTDLLAAKQSLWTIRKFIEIHLKKRGGVQS